MKTAALKLMVNEVKESRNSRGSRNQIQNKKGTIVGKKMQTIEQTNSQIMSYIMKIKIMNRKTELKRPAHTIDMTRVMPLIS